MGKAPKAPQVNEVIGKKIMTDNTSIDEDIKAFKEAVHEWMSASFCFLDDDDCRDKAEIAFTNLTEIRYYLVRKYNLYKKHELDMRGIFTSHLDIYDELEKVREKKEDIYYYAVDSDCNNQNIDEMSKNLNDILCYIDCNRYNGLMEISVLQEVKRQFWVEIESHKNTANERKCFDTRQEAEEFLKSNE